VLERVDDACAADGIRRFIGSEAGVEGFGRARSWGIESVAVSHEDAFVRDSQQNNVSCVAFGEWCFEECGNISMKDLCKSAFSHINSFFLLQSKKPGGLS
jgi:hypothetical protein